MSKDVISVHGEDVAVREDTAKAFRGVNWAIISIGAFVVIAAIIFFTLFISSTTGGSVENPSQIKNSNSN